MSIIHQSVYEHAGKTVTFRTPLALYPGHELYSGKFTIEDWWDGPFGNSWMFADGNPAALKYAMRAGLAGLPVDDEVVYGKDEYGRGHLVHVSELDLGGAL